MPARPGLSRRGSTRPFVAGLGCQAEGQQARQEEAGGEHSARLCSDFASPGTENIRSAQITSELPPTPSLSHHHTSPLTDRGFESLQSDESKESNIAKQSCLCVGLLGHVETTG